MWLYKFDREEFAYLGDPVTSLDFHIETDDELIVSFFCINDIFCGENDFVFLVISALIVNR